MTYSASSQSSEVPPSTLVATGPVADLPGARPRLKVLVTSPTDLADQTGEPTAA